MKEFRDVLMVKVLDLQCIEQEADGMVIVSPYTAVH